MKHKIKQLSIWWVSRPLEQRIRTGILTGGFIFILMYVLLFLRQKEVFLGIIVYFGFWLTTETYLWTKKIERSRFGNEKRHEFITNKIFTDIQRRIEHHDPELQTVLATLNIEDPSPYEVEFFLRSQTDNMRSRGKDNPDIYMQRLHEDFDNYLNWMEGLALLWEKGLIEDDELKGLWSYYMKRLREAELNEDTLKQYLKDVWQYDDVSVEQFCSSRREQFQDKPATCPIENKRIDPITRPVWFYINNPLYEFESTLVELAKHCHELTRKTQVNKNLIGEMKAKS